MEFQVEGMSCGGCADAVRRAVRKVVPDAAVEVDLAGRRVTVAAAPDAAAETVAAAIGRAGFTARAVG